MNDNWKELERKSQNRVGLESASVRPILLYKGKTNNTSEYDSNKEYIDEEALNQFINDGDDDDDHHVHHNHRHHQQDRHHRRDIHKVSE
ncbi:unnamed protein product [Schistosoma mattheei]|uniref:Uncharacterized protein n=1 Tax=Schistosoma mattheei TaxID=31246 RepID=A0A183PRS2_9TREM|nr:unnamed protein product [Schistosoma mattheei]